MSFSEAIAAFTVRVSGKTEEACRAIANQIGDKLVQRTPLGSPEQVDDPGQARGNWQAEIGGPALGPINNPDPSGAMAKEAIHSVVRNWKPRDGSSLWITNSLDYMPCIEYGLYPNPPKRGTGRTVNGYSTQAPHGVLGITVAEFDGIAENAFAGRGQWDIGEAGE